jgi:hypothetical protein
MVKQISRMLCAALVVVITASKPGLAQSEAETVRSLLSGRTMTVTYRDGGPINGTHQQMYVSFCPSGSYFSQGGSWRTTILENQERSSFSDKGTWSVSELGNLVAVQYQSVSGEVTSFLVHLLPDGRIWAGTGITVIPQGPALCS